MPDTKGFPMLKAAFLVDNGFCEREFSLASSAMASLGLTGRIISFGNDLLSAWNEKTTSNNADWGAKYAPDTNLADAQSSEYDVLIIPGGKRSVEKMKLHASVRAFLSGFIDTGKPVLIFNAAHDLLEFFEFTDYTQQAASLKVFSVNKNLISIHGYSDDIDAICNAISKIILLKDAVVSTAADEKANKAA